ncbi:MAG: hypothetical protein WAS36_03565 [Candidatus Saccharimonadales bacterium]
MPEILPIQFDENTPEDVLFFGVVGTLDLAAKDEAGPDWPEGNMRKFSTKKEIVMKLPYAIHDEETGVDETGEHVIDTSSFWFSGEAKEHPDTEELVTSYEVGLRVKVACPLQEIPDHHLSKVFDYFLHRNPEVIDAAADAAGLIDEDTDTLSNDNPTHKLAFMREAIEAILASTDEPLTMWESIAYEVDEAQLLVAYILRRGYDVGEDEVPLCEYDSSGSFSAVRYVHGQNVDEFKPEAVYLPIVSEGLSDNDPDKFDPDTLLFHIDFLQMAYLNFKEEEILGEPAHVHAQMVLELLKRYRQPFIELDKNES